MPVSALASLVPAPWSASLIVEAKVVSLADLRNFGQDGLFFSAIIADASGSMRVAFFDAHAKATYAKLHVGESYRFEGLVVKENDPRYRATGKYGLVSPRKSEPLAVTTLDAPVATSVPVATSIASISDQTVGPLHIIGVVASLEPVAEFKRRDGKLLRKRSLVMADSSGSSIQVTLWDARAENPLLEEGAVLRLADVNPSPFHGLSLSSSSSTSIQRVLGEPAAVLRTWFAEHKEDVRVVGPQKVRLLAAIGAGGLVDVTIDGIRQDRQLVQHAEEGLALTLLVRLSDTSAKATVVFNEPFSSMLVGASAEVINELIEQKDAHGIASLFDKAVGRQVCVALARSGDSGLYKVQKFESK